MKDNKNNSFSLFRGFIKDNKERYITGIIILFAVNILQLTVPKITGNIVNITVEGNITERGLFFYCCAILGIALFVFILHYLSRIQIMGAANLFDFLIRKKMFRHLETLSMNFFNKTGVGNIMALSINDLSAIRMAMGRGVTLVSNTIILMVSSIIIMARTMNFKLTLLLFLPFPVLIFIMVEFGIVINRRFKKVQQSFADLTAKAQENISGIRVIKSFAREDRETENFKAMNLENYKINMSLVRVQGIFGPLISLISNLSFLIILFFGGMLVIDNKISIGDFIAFNSYIFIIIRPVGMIGMIISLIQRSRASADRIKQLFEVRPEIFDKDPNMTESFGSKRFDGKIEFKDLTFGYNNCSHKALKNITITVEPGKTVALIGRVGAGKSTLANLLLRIYNTENNGQILIDGKDINDIPLKVLRDNIGYIPQDNFLFSQTINNNIAFSLEGFKPEEIENASKISQVYDNIIEFLDRFETILGERGVNLSGGQKQRVSIARAVIKNPSILIMDDCFSSVDTKTEKKILDGMRDVITSRTTIIIAHRISTVMDADEIVVLENGEIIERGRHQDLIDLKGYYYRMYQRQLLEAAVNETPVEENRII